MTESLEANLVVIGPTGRGVLDKLNPKWIQSIAQIQAARNNPSLKFLNYHTSYIPSADRYVGPLESIGIDGVRELGFIGGDGVVYAVDGGKVLFSLTDSANNPLFNAPKNAFDYVGNRHVILTKDESESLESRIKSTSRPFVLSDLPLIEYQSERFEKYACIRVKRDKLIEGRDAFLKEHGEEITRLFGSLHGSSIYGRDGLVRPELRRSNMDVEVWFYRPSYVMERLGQTEKGMLTTFSYVNGLQNNFDVFLAGVINGHLLLPINTELKRTITEWDRSHREAHERWSNVDRRI